jgi:exportin-7
MDDAQLSQVEYLCEILYTGSPTVAGGDEITRDEAQSRLLSLQSSASFIPQCQYILDRSASQYALLVASNSLTELITTHWNNFTIAQRIDIRNYVLGYLANNGPTLRDFVTLSLIQLVCRITKLGWFDDPTHRELTADVTKFLQASVGHCILGLKILNQLVDELNIPTSGGTLTQHRKTSVSFRDLCLYKVFQLGLTTLKQLQARAISTADARQEAALGEQALSLTVRCLNFDFIGTNPDESTEDVGTIQAPTNWRPVLQDPATTELLLDFYANTDPPRSSRAMEAVILICSVRRSLFPSDKEREAFLGRVMTGIRELLKNQTGLQHQDNYHQFCRLLGRLKSNYQLSELVKTEGYLEWLDLAASFTTQSTQNWQYSTNSIHYLLALWGRLVAAVPYVRPETGAKGHVQALENHVLNVVECYIDSMLGSVETVLRSEGALEDPLEDEGSLMEQLDRLPTICRFQYSAVATIIVGKFDPILQKYRELMQHLVSTSTDSAPPNVAQQVTILEGQLTWLTYIVGSIVGGHSWSSSQVGNGEETLDASLSKRVLQLSQFIDYRLTQSNGAGKADSKLEVAMLYYFQNFRRVYMFMWEQTGASGGSGVGSMKLESVPSTKQKVYLNMFENMGLGDHTVVANLIVTKMGKNLKFWPDELDIVAKTLELLTDMAGGYSSSKLLLTLSTVKYLASHHTHDEFPFLYVPSNARHRTTFHAILVRLLLSPGGEETLQLTFDQFMEPIIKTMAQLGALDSSQLRSEEARMPLIGVFRDLRGVAISLHNRRTFGMLFDIIEPQHTPLLTKVADLWYDQPDVMISLLRFVHEFCHNKANRVNFDQSSPNGILLFRATSDVICALGRRMLANSSLPSGDIYKLRYKGMSIALSVLNSALGGNYVCFGVFALYNDPALDNALDISLKMVLSIPLEQVVAYPKLSKSVFGFVEIFFRNHIKSVMALNTNVFMQLMNAVHEGLQSSDAQISSMCANSIDHLATLYCENSGKDRPEIRNLNKHLELQPNLFSSLTATLFNLLLFGAPQNHWAVIRPMLSLMLASESSFTAYKDHLMSTQDSTNQAKLNEAFNKLLADVSRSLESANRERFTQKLTAFRVSTRAFLTL